MCEHSRCVNISLYVAGSDKMKTALSTHYFFGMMQPKGINFLGVIAQYMKSGSAKFDFEKAKQN